MNVQSYADQVALLYTSIFDIAGNIRFIQRELPNLKLPDSERLHIRQTFDTFQYAVFDVQKEIGNLEDKLGMRPGQPPFDPDIKNPDPRVTMGFIADWLWSEIEDMLRTVSRLDAAARVSPDLGSAYLLVGESATNILHAYMKVKDALDAIAERLQSSRSAVEDSDADLMELGRS